MKYLIRENRPAIKAALKKHPEVKKFEVGETRIRIFYAEDADLQKNLDNGLTHRIEDELAGILGTGEGFDEFPTGFTTFSSLKTPKKKDVKPWFMV